MPVSKQLGDALYVMICFSDQPRFELNIVSKYFDYLFFILKWRLSSRNFPETDVNFLHLFDAGHWI